MANPDIDFSVRITVIGRASKRWKGVTNEATADLNNYYLSLDRAKAVHAWLMPILKANIRTPGVTIEPISSGPPKGLEAGFTAVGSAQPLVKGPPDENAAANRSVQVSVELVTTHHYKQYKSRPKVISARTPSWTAKVMNFTQMSAAVSGGRIDLILRNNYSMKEMKAHAYLAGGNVSTSVVSLTRGTGPIGDEVSFDADRALGFDDFDGVFVNVADMGGSATINNPLIPSWVPIVGGGPGVKTKGMYITFRGLGPRAEKLVFYKDTSLTWGGTNSHYSFLSGKLVLDGTNPGDWVEDGTIDDVIPRANKDTDMDGIVVSFPTEKSGVADIDSDDQKRLKDFAMRQTQRIDLFAKAFTLTKR